MNTTPSEISSRSGILSQLLEEAERLAAWPSGAEQFGPLLLSLLGLFLGLALLRRLRPSSQFTLVVGLTLTTAVIAALIDVVARDRPLLGLLLVAMPASAALFHLGNKVAPWWSGITLILSGRIRSGDFVAIDQVRGIFKGGDMVRAQVEDDNGVHVYLPWSAFAGKVVSRASDAPRLARIPVTFSAVPNPEERRQLEIRATLCPYRVWSRPVLVRPHPEHPERLEVELWSWSDEGARLSEDFLRRAARRDTPERPRSG